MADKTINLAIDAMGGDNAPFEIIKGAVLSVQNNNKINILLVGDEIQIKNSLSQLGPEALESIETNRITIIPSEGVIKDGDQPIIALKKNPKASIVSFHRRISRFLVNFGWPRRLRFKQWQQPKERIRHSLIHSPREYNQKKSDLSRKIWT